MSSFYDLPAGHLGDALDAAMSQAVRHPPAHEKFFKYPGLIEVDWERAASCHHSNVPIVGTIGAMIDPVAAAGALDKVRLASIVGGVSKLDWNQSGLLAAAAGRPGAEQLREPFGPAVRAFIAAERLEPYFEFSEVQGNSGDQDFGIRPAGYAEFGRAAQMAYAAGEEPEQRNLFDEMRQRANDRRLDVGGRVALVAVMALYNEYDTTERFKGRGWVLTARDFGDYLRNRAERLPVAFDNLLLAMATYHGW